MRALTKPQQPSSRTFVSPTMLAYQLTLELRKAEKTWAKKKRNLEKELLRGQVAFDKKKLELERAIEEAETEARAMCQRRDELDVTPTKRSLKHEDTSDRPSKRKRN